MTDQMKAIGMPMVLLATLWGAVNVVLNAFDIINERRDLVFELIDNCQRCPEQILGPLEIYWTNVLPLTSGLCLFLAIVTTVLFSLPNYVRVDDETYYRKVRFASRFIATLPLFALTAFVAGGLFDAYTLAAELSRIPVR